MTRATHQFVDVGFSRTGSLVLREMIGRIIVVPLSLIVDRQRERGQVVWPSRQWAVPLEQMEPLFSDGVTAGLSDGQLLTRFIDDRDPDAFEVLVARHGPMVLSVCRGVLHDPSDAEDAFQANFLVMLKKAGTIRGRMLWVGGSIRSPMASLSRPTWAKHDGGRMKRRRDRWPPQ